MDGGFWGWGGVWGGTAHKPTAPDPPRSTQPGTFSPLSGVKGEA